MSEYIKEDKKQKMNQYFDIQEQYYSYLKEKMPNMFKGEAKEATGMVKTGGYHSQWSFLSTLEQEKQFRTIALKCMSGSEVILIIRNGESFMKACCNDELFPKMQILEPLNTKVYGRKNYNSTCYIWNVNEVCTLFNE